MNLTSNLIDYLFRYFSYYIKTQSKYMNYVRLSTIMKKKEKKGKNNSNYTIILV